LIFYDFLFFRTKKSKKKENMDKMFLKNEKSFGIKKVKERFF